MNRRIREMLLQRETFTPLLALVFASVVSVALVAARTVWTGKLAHLFLVWNLFLAWLPLLFALLVFDQYRRGAARNWRVFALSGAWLLFFPNAPYIFTDLIHLTSRFYRHFWVDLSLVLLCALTGFVLGFVSLYLMQSVVARLYGRLAGWVFIGVVAGLSGIGIYLGRFLRFNSWDVIVKPVKLYQGIGAWAADPLAHSTSYAFPLLFAVFVFMAYVMLYALTHLPRAQQWEMVANRQQA